jgi:hypothetical protein
MRVRISPVIPGVADIYERTDDPPKKLGPGCFNALRDEC